MDALTGSSGRVILKHAFILRRRGYLPAALEAFRWASGYSKSRRPALIELCRTLLEMAAVADAEIVFDEIAHEWPDAWDIQELRGRIDMAVERFPAARNAFRRAVAAMPDNVSRPQIYSPAVYMESLCDDGDAALLMLGRSAIPRANEPDVHQGPSKMRLGSDVLLRIEREVRRLATPWVVPGRRVAAYFLDPGLTLGHAVIEPFYFANLVAHAYDDVVVLGPPRSKLSRAAQIGLRLSCARLIYVETDDPMLRLAGQVEAGAHSCGNLDLVFHNYHGLCRAMFEARLDLNHPAHGRRRYIKLTPDATERGDEFLHLRGLGRRPPIVALHIRSHNRSDHDWAADSFRNVDATRFEPAIRWLMDRGMLVVRLGDRDSPPLAIKSEQFIDLPRSPDYHAILDPYFVHGARFMISSQSGPCAYARAFGVPNLVANSHMFYATLPERQELLAFRPAFRVVDGERALLNANTLIMDQLMRFQMDASVRDAGLSFGDLSSETIRAATQEMDAWVADPEQPQSAAQQRFRELCTKASAPGADGRRNIVGGFVGYGLPEARLADALVAADPDFV
jgi:putative glycosyltransferase (TIGR04372 family)